jgi:hypothetical protein
MAHLFTITPASDSLVLDKGRGEIVYTVFNTLGTPLRGRAKVVPLGSTKQEWLALRGESERDFSASGTQQFTVDFAAPEGAAAGKYPFRLDVLSVVNPDEDFTEGPAVTAEITAAPPPPPKRSFPAWIIPLVLGVLLVGGLLTWLALRGGGDDSVNANVANVSTPAVSPTASSATPNANQTQPSPTATLGPPPTAPPSPSATKQTPTPSPTPFRVNSVTLAANPNRYDGKCPAQISMTATIAATRDGIIKYRVVRSDEKYKKRQEQQDTVQPNGYLVIKWNESFGEDRFPLFRDKKITVQIIITYPQEKESNKAEVTVDCDF